MSDIWGKIRTAGLIVMITFAVLCEFILIWQHMWYWALYWGVGVIAGVGITEIIAYAMTKKTISTQWRDWAKENPLVAYAALACMAISFIGLIVHLAVWGGMFNK